MKMIIIKKNVSKIGIILLIFNSIFLTSCNIFDSPDTKHEASIEFEHQWNGEEIELNKYYKFQHPKTNINTPNVIDSIKFENIKYTISNVKLIHKKSKNTTDISSLKTIQTPVKERNNNLYADDLEGGDYTLQFNLGLNLVFEKSSFKIEGNTKKISTKINTETAFKYDIAPIKNDEINPIQITFDNFEIWYFVNTATINVDLAKLFENPNIDIEKLSNKPVNDKNNQQKMLENAKKMFSSKFYYD
ncbi:MbnP family protein [Tenacibaculum piscium]|uniref:MbnP family protein n=1 Tax=Tenacibaculum piscium TaxID=1458515 RepID=UPI001EFACFD5|nr:MbnP family protein [Tenacibaculum piscium]MCG8182635.1 hypothetical protein [Tenacibaculum piscium]MCG8204027.1 hypothetical protein [Tenacibaculum piscium]